MEASSLQSTDCFSQLQSYLQQQSQLILFCLVDSNFVVMGVFLVLSLVLNLSLLLILGKRRLIIWFPATLPDAQVLVAEEAIAVA